jgi:hypothetical protein
MEDGIEVSFKWLREEALPILEREAQAMEWSREYRGAGDSIARRRQAAPRTEPERKFISGLREVARAVGYHLEIRI